MDVNAEIERITKSQDKTKEPHGNCPCRDWVVWRGWYRHDVGILLDEIKRLNAEGA